MPALVPAVIAQLKTHVTALRSVEGAKAWAALMQSNALPQVTPAAHVLPLSIQGAGADAMSGAYTQMFDETIGVVLTLRNNDRLGSASLDNLDSLIRDVMEAIAGWAPGDEVGVFRVARGGIVNAPGHPGVVVYQLDFTISDQLRING